MIGTLIEIMIVWFALSVAVGAAWAAIRRAGR